MENSEAIKYLKWMRDTFYSDKSHKAFDMAISALEKQRWSPVSERLPSKEGRYMVTRNDYVTNTEFIDVLWYEKNLWWNGHSTGDYAVTAWMSLPEPYQEDKA